MAAPASTGQDAQDGFLEEDFDCTGESSCDLRGVHKSGSDSDDDGNRVIRDDKDAKPRGCEEVVFVIS